MNKQSGLEIKLNKLRNIITKSELITGLKECGFQVYSDPDTEHGWEDDGLNDTVVKIIPHSSAVIPLDWYCEGKGRKDAFLEDVIDNILESIEYNFNRFLLEKKFVKKMYKILFDEDYKIEIPKNPSLEDKLNYINKGIESVDDKFIDKLLEIGIDNLKYEDGVCTYYPLEEQESLFGYVIYYFNDNTQKNSTVYECMRELARLYNINEAN